MKQKFTSSNTSINKYKLPIIYKADIPRGSSVLDYGCGKYVDHLKSKAEKNGWVWRGYDPFNYKKEISENNDYVLCSNVLNVIAEDEIVNSVIRTCMDLCTKGAVFTVYQRTGNGIGCQTGEDQYQRNEKISAYVDRIRSLGFYPYVKNKIIYVPKIKKGA